jgi:hypothetical protein
MYPVRKYVQTAHDAECYATVEKVFAHLPRREGSQLRLQINTRHHDESIAAPPCNFELRGNKSQERWRRRRDER